MHFACEFSPFRIQILTWTQPWVCILQSADKQGNFTFMRRAQNADTHALQQHRLSQNSSPSSAPVLYWLSHPTCILRLKAKNIDFHTGKSVQNPATLFRHFQLQMSRNEQHFFATFRRTLIIRNLTYIYCNLTTCIEVTEVIKGRYSHRLPRPQIERKQFAAYLHRRKVRRCIFSNRTRLLCNSQEPQSSFSLSEVSYVLCLFYFEP